MFFHSVFSKSTTGVKLLATDVVNPNLLFEVTTTAPELEGILSKTNVNNETRHLVWTTYEPVFYVLVPKSSLFHLPIRLIYP